ncbi:oxidized purine nucleoside triphosphate hydrolase-like [Oratosquilla oratoria]|uniref:oxidized purine nucleoside triphosphate hydrolase-like n=1 Tax=Oratosquilla oratoria TaxID=337810 RepID=UPI003F769108
MSGYVRKAYTLVVLRSDKQILLGLKKRGFGQGRWNGFGGKVEKGETPMDAAKREMEEEAMIQTPNLEKVGEIEFTFEGENRLMFVHVFSANEYTGMPSETEEMLPKWFPEDNLPYSQMWPDDILWYPLFLQGAKFKGAFHFEGHDKILKSTLQKVEGFAQN